MKCCLTRLIVTLNRFSETILFFQTQQVFANKLITQYNIIAGNNCNRFYWHSPYWKLCNRPVSGSDGSPTVSDTWN